MMKYLGIVILAVIFFLACSLNKGTLSFSENLNQSVLQLWENRTHININDQKDHKLLLRLEAERKDNISMFERKAFLSDISKMRKLDAYRFDSLTIVEVNRSGERYRRIKYIIVHCSLETSVIKFQLNQRKWELLKIQKVNTEKVRKKIAILVNKSNMNKYWGSNINDLVAVSKFLIKNEISVKVLGSLNEKQYVALDIMEED